MSNRRVRWLVAGGVMIVAGVVVGAAFQVGSCATGPSGGWCTSGPHPAALLMGLALAIAGVVMMYSGGRKR